jgi:hypothetical protein
MELTDKLAGKLVEHGVAPYEQEATNRDSYSVTWQTKGSA